MNEKDQEYLRGLAEVLENAYRVGADVDSPEGVRWIEISDELATIIVEQLRAIAARAESERNAGRGVMDGDCSGAKCIPSNRR